MESENLRKMFIGGLHYETTSESLQSFYQQWGEVVDVVVMKDPTTKRSRGFGFVTYSRAHMVDDALRAKPHTIDGKQVDPKRATPKEEAGNPVAHQPTKKVFVGGIREITEQSDLIDYFSQFGTVLRADIAMDKSTGRKRGFAFVTFSDWDSVDKCVLVHSHTINGNPCEVKKAVERDSESSGGPNSRGGGSRGGPAAPRGGGGYSSYPPSSGSGYNAYGATPGGDYGMGGGYGVGEYSAGTGGYGVGGYGAAPGGYGATPGAYGAAAGSYEASAGGYGAAGSYGAAPGGYGVAPVGYGASGYGANTGSWSQQSTAYSDPYSAGGFGAGYGSSNGGGAIKSAGGYGQRSTGPYAAAGAHGTSTAAYGATYGGEYGSVGAAYGVGGAGGYGAYGQS